MIGQMILDPLVPLAVLYGLAALAVLGLDFIMTALMYGDE